jgi:transcriptional regulator of acetoin/glycerol metabolism
LDYDISGSNSLAELERNTMLAALRRFDGDVEMAAKQLGISRATLYRRLKVIREKKKE